MALDQTDISKTGKKKEPKCYNLDEVATFMPVYEKWYEEYLESQSDSETSTGENPSTPPPPPPGGN